MDHKSRLAGVFIWLVHPQKVHTAPGQLVSPGQLEECLQQQRNTLFNNSCTGLGLITVPTFYLPCIHQMSKFPEDMARFGGVSYAIKMLTFKYRLLGKCDWHMESQ